MDILDQLKLGCLVVVFIITVTLVYNHLKDDDVLREQLAQANLQITTLKIDNENLQGKVRAFSEIIDAKQAENTNLNSVLQEAYKTLSEQSSDMKEIEVVLSNPNEWLYKQDTYSETLKRTLVTLPTEEVQEPEQPQEEPAYETITEDQNLAGLMYLNQQLATIN